MASWYIGGPKRKSATLNRSQHGYTFIEVLVVMVILGVLASLTIPNLFNSRERALMARAGAEMNTMRSAIELFLLKYGDYPADVDRNVPPGIEEFIQGSDADAWPNAPWPDSVYDYDAFDTEGEWAFQISIRFCEIGRPDTCKFPRTPWAEDFGVNSSVYFCLEGACKPHPDQPATYPGYCLNCDDPLVSPASQL